MRYSTLISLILIALSFLAATAQQPPDTVWTRTYGGYDTDKGYCVKQTTEGGYIIAGRTQSFGTGVYAAYLIRTDVNGDTLWTRVFAGNHWYSFWSVVQVSDGGFAVVGTCSEAPGRNEVYFIKTDENGNTIWTRRYGGNGNDEAFCLQKTSDGGFIICGNTESYGAGLYDVLLLKTDASGHPSWFRTYGGSGVDYGSYVEQTTDGGYIITGSGSPSIGGYDVYLIKTDSLGNMHWLRTFGGNRNDFGYCVRQIADGGFVIAGETYSFGNGEKDVYLVRTNFSGDTLWTKTFGGSDWDVGYSVLQTSDSGYIIAGETISFGAGYYDAYLIKTDVNGDTLWTRTYGSFGTEEFWDIHPTLDNGFVLCGLTSSFGAGDTDVWLVKLEGNMTLSLTPTIPTIIIPSSGGSFDFTSSIYNGMAYTMIFDAWTMVILPNGSIYSPVILRVGLNIAPAATITREINQYVPGNAPPGNYMYIGNVGVYPDTVWSSDEFPFVKRP